MLVDEVERAMLRSIIEEREKCADAAPKVILAVHDYLLAAAQGVSSTGKPYTDNEYGRAAAIIMRCWHPDRLEAELNQPPYKPQ